ncbi:MAG: PAS domain-containing protein [Alphaproteobacteria bacterium]|nr:PAS domain-containing protein [Alphaproteobacteria bacterium]
MTAAAAGAGDALPGGTSGGRRRYVFSILGAVLLSAATMAALIGIVRFADAERERELAGWRARLGIVADSRLAQVQGWIDAQLAEMRALAENQSVQLYLTELELAQGDRSAVTDEPAQFGYLRNLLTVMAERTGFTATRPSAAIGANVRRADGGIALLDDQGRPIVASPVMPPLDAAMQARLAASPKDRPSAIDLFAGPGGQPMMGFVAPIFGVQADPGTSERIGFVLGLREIGEPFYALLKQPGAVEASAEALLLRRAGPATGGAIEYLSPQRDGTPPFRRTAPADAADLVEAAAVAKPGGFHQGRDYRGSEVLAVSRAVATLPWVLLYKVDRGEALAESDRHRRNLIIGLVLVAATVSTAFVAVWWYASSRRASDAALRHRTLAVHLQQEEALLRLVTDSQPDLIYLVDRDGILQFANAAVARRYGGDAASLAGKPIVSVVGPDHARHVTEINRKALKQQRPKTRLLRVPSAEGGERIMQTGHVPLDRSAGRPGAVLVVERDVTQAVIERERRSAVLRQLVDAMVRLVDRRDPYCADQAGRVGRVAGEIADAMGIDAVDRATVEIAASLMNLGKVLVPTEVLTKSERLSDAELKLVRDSILNSAELVAGVEFDGPVQDTLRQLQERADGSGYPAGLKGDAILLPARILAVANAFVSMVSPRSWRDAIGIDQAVETLRAERGTAFDRAVVTALEHVLENRGGRERWRDFARKPERGTAG